MTYDYLVVGAGFAGSTVAERLASQCGASVLVVDARDHVAGNAYDPFDEHGIRIHRYGPHIFHTSSERVVEYLSQFTAWRPYEHRVLSHVEGRDVPMPICSRTIAALYGLDLDAAGMRAFFDARRDGTRICSLPATRASSGAWTHETSTRACVAGSRSA
jgi:UDP-galactopyranose mutase